MIDIFLATQLTCPDYISIIKNIESRGYSDIIRNELVETVKFSAEDDGLECKWDAND